LPRFGGHKTTVLTGKLEIMIFKEAVHEDDELAHAGGHGDGTISTVPGLVERNHMFWIDNVH